MKGPQEKTKKQKSNAEWKRKKNKVAPQHAKANHDHETRPVKRQKLTANEESPLPSDHEESIDQDIEDEPELSQDEEGQEQESELKEPEGEPEENAPDGIMAFPDLLGHQSKPTDSDLTILRNMGIPEWLAKPTVISPKESCGLDECGLSERLVKQCTNLGLTSLFAVQKAVIPVFLQRQSLYDTRRPPGDLCISAPTGSGKTLAYVLPIVDILSKRRVTRLRALVVLPTRDLAVQVKETFDAFVKGTGLKVATVIGQHSFAHEQSLLVGKLSDGEVYAGGLSRVDILIATPGRLTDHIKSTPNFSLQHLRFLVIDEADRLLNQSYNDWLNQILNATRPKTDSHHVPLGFKRNHHGVSQADALAPNFLRSHFSLPRTDIDLTKAPTIQKLLFSATLTKNPAKIAGLHLVNPEYISIQKEKGAEDTEYSTPEGLEEFMVPCATENKPLMMIHLLHHLNITSCLCFTKSIESTVRLRMLLEAYEKLQADVEPLVVAEFTSEHSASERKSLLKRFQDGKVHVLICSDVIGRGIDLDNVQVVINYDRPLYMDKYIHRVGRTARAGREGKAYTLVENQDVRHFKEMLREAGHLAQVKMIRTDPKHLQKYQQQYQDALSSL